ncbi:hypothetical protein ACO0RG_001100 [Hanseniaspora osmophila]
MTKSQTVIVGLSGASSSGKTTLAKLITQLLPPENVILIHEDDFFKHDDEVPIDEKYGIANWDCPEALDLASFDEELKLIKLNGTAAISKELIHNNNVDSIDKFELDQTLLEKIKQGFANMIPASCKIIIVDGFMMYQDDVLRSKFDVKLLVRAPYATLKKRRAARPGYQTLESFWVDPPYYFDEFVYKSYKQSHARLFMDDNVESQNGVRPEFGISLFDNDDATPIERGLEWIFNALQTHFSP